MLGVPTTADRRMIDLSSHVVRMPLSGVAIRKGVGVDVLGDSQIAVTWIAIELRSHEIGLLASQVVTTATSVVRDQLHSLVIHRIPSSGIPSKPILSFADKEEEHPLGRLLTFHGGRFASTYRIRDDEIVVVNRSLGRENMSLQMLETERNAENKVLPRAYQVQYRDASTGAITRVETFRHRWQRLGKLDLPELLTQTVSSAAGVNVRSLKLQSLKSVE